MHSGKACIITKQGMTHGKHGHVKGFDVSANKWEIEFDSPWVGWYSDGEFQVIEAVMPSMSYSF